MHFVFTLEVILSRTSNQSLLGPDGRLGTAAARQPGGAQVCNSVSQVVQPRLPIYMYGACRYSKYPDIPEFQIPKIPIMGFPWATDPHLKAPSTSKLKCASRLAKWYSHTYTFAIHMILDIPRIPEIAGFDMTYLLILFACWNIWSFSNMKFVRGEICILFYAWCPIVNAHFEFVDLYILYSGF